MKLILLLLFLIYVLICDLVNKLKFWFWVNLIN